MNSVKSLFTKLNLTILESSGIQTSNVIIYTYQTESENLFYWLGNCLSNNYMTFSKIIENITDIGF